MAVRAEQGALVGQRLGKYDLLALLAIGGTAEIYIARIGGEAGFEKLVVAKCLLDHLTEDEEYVRMFLDEARIGAQLDHSNIVQTLELGRHERRYYMIMEYLPGMSVASLAKKAKTRTPRGLPVDVSLSLAAQACAGLHYAHERDAADGRPLNIIHRDVTPQNLVVSFDGVLKLVDFGIAKADLRETHTRSGTIKGKFAYMSPEQCRGEAIDRRTDVFALGVILHELLTGERLFKRESTYETYQAIINGEIPAPSARNHHLDPGMDSVVLKALERDREKRFATAEALGEAIQQLLHRRGKSLGAAEVGRCFERYFRPEIELHAARMRELLTQGRSELADIAWYQAEVESDPDTVAPEARGSSTGEETVDESGDDPLDAPTRIEANPALQAETMHAQQAGAAAPESGPRATSLGVAVFPRQATRPQATDRSQPTQRSIAVGRDPSGPAPLPPTPASPVPPGQPPAAANAPPPANQPPLAPRAPQPNPIRVGGQGGGGEIGGQSGPTLPARPASFLRPSGLGAVPHPGQGAMPTASAPPRAPTPLAPVAPVAPREPNSEAGFWPAAPGFAVTADPTEATRIELTTIDETGTTAAAIARIATTAGFPSQRGSAPAVNPAPTPSPTPSHLPLWVLAVGFLVALGVGLGATVLVGRAFL